MDVTLQRCRKWVEDALEFCDGTHDWEDIENGINKGTMQLWPAARGCIVTEIVVYPRKKIINIFLAGGKLDQILDMNDDVGAWAKAHGCTGATMTGRVGWTKPLKPLGWKVLHTQFAKDI